MVFASSRDALKRSLNGVAVELQGTDYSEVSYENCEWSISVPFVKPFVLSPFRLLFACIHLLSLSSPGILLLP